MVLIVLEPLEEAEGSPVEDFTSGALQDNFLIDFRHFCRLSGEREDIPYDELALAYRFQELDPEDTGYVTVGDFTYDSLWALLKRRYSRARALFRAWDEEDTFVSGDLSVQEFRKTIRALGFKATNGELATVMPRLIGFQPNSDRFSYRELFHALKEEIAVNTPLPEVTQADRDHQAAIETTVVASEQHLREIIERNLGKVVDLFNEWDDDGSGTIDHNEFYVALCSIGLDVPKAAADNLFDKWDDDGSGHIDYRELNKKLRKRAELDSKLRAGAKGEVAVKAKNRILLRQKSGPVGVTLRGFTLDSDKSITEQLITAMAESKARIISLFQEWDTSGDGRVTKNELLRALRQIGLADGDKGRAGVDELFGRIDKDKSVRARHAVHARASF